MFLEIVTSYKCGIVKCSTKKSVLMDTICKYREMVIFCINVVNSEWDKITSLASRLRVNFVEHLIHNTANNKAKYDFDKNFYKCPSYLRRGAIAAAIGHVGSYRSNLKNWETNNKKDEEPKLPKEVKDFPCLYRDNMYVKESSDTMYIKVFKDNDWKWITVKLKHNDVSYILKHCIGKKESCPSLVKRGKVYFLSFTYTEYQELIDKPAADYKVVGADLGLNTHAVCSVLDKEGTVYARKFIDIAYEKDQLNHVLNRIRKHQSLNMSTDILWRKAKYLNSEISRKTAKGIIDFALVNKADCIVFEHLDVHGKKRGKRKQLLHHWKCQEIQNIVALRAHQNGMHISHICAWGTSKYAFDGSGEVKRDAKNYSLCTFTSRKRYNCDLSASYNIGARFFLRELNKLDSALSIIKTPQRTLQTLKDYNSGKLFKAA